MTNRQLANRIVAILAVVYLAVIGYTQLANELVKCPTDTVKIGTWNAGIVCLPGTEIHHGILDGIK